MKNSMIYALHAQGLKVSLAGVEVLHDLNLGLASGCWTSVVGPNGAGKSTLLKALAGLLPAQGRVSLSGQDLHSMAGRERARHLSWLGQSELAADDLSVYDVAMLGRLPHQSWLASPNAADRAAVEQALRSTGAWDWRDRQLAQLSSGERQRVLLARALSVQADVLLMDEPLVNLDLPHQVDWLLLVRELVDSGKTVVSVLHEISLALQADHMVVMARGRIVHQGACFDAATHRAVEQVFEQRISIRAVGPQWVAIPRIQA